MYSTVKFEEPRQKPVIVQCSKCQDLGHTKTYCHHQARCVRCAGPHASNTCQIPRDQPPKCALCGEDHPASYKGCIVYKKYYKLRTHNIALKCSQLNKETYTQPPEIDITNFPELPKQTTHSTQQEPTTSTEIAHPQQESTKTSTHTTIKKQQPRRQAPQASQAKPHTPNPLIFHPPRQQIPPHHLPLRVKLPPQQSHPSHPNAQKKNPAQVSSNPVPPRTQQRIPLSVNTPYPPPEPILNPLHNQHPSDLTSILSSFLLDLQNTIKPLITLLTRILTEIPFNFPR